MEKKSFFAFSTKALSYSFISSSSFRPLSILRGLLGLSLIWVRGINFKVIKLAYKQVKQSFFYKKNTICGDCKKNGSGKSSRNASSTYASIILYFCNKIK